MHAKYARSASLFYLIIMWFGRVRAFTSAKRAVHPFPSWRLYSSVTDSQTARVLFLGTPDVAASSLRSIVEDSQKDNSSYQVVGVVTQPPKRRKRKGKEIPSPVGYTAEELDIPVLCPEKVSTWTWEFVRKASFVSP